MGVNRFAAKLKGGRMKLIIEAKEQGEGVELDVQVEDEDDATMNEIDMIEAIASSLRRALEDSGGIKIDYSLN